MFIRCFRHGVKHCTTLLRAREIVSTGAAARHLSGACVAILWLHQHAVSSLVVLRHPGSRRPADSGSPLPSEPIAPHIELEPHRLKDPSKIAAELQALAAEATCITLYPAGSDAFLFCCVQTVDVAGRRFVLQAMASTAPPAGDTLFVAIRGDAKLQFCLLAQWTVDEGGPPRLSADFPDDLVRLQRREFQRLEAPLGRSCTAEFMLGAQLYQLSVSDISLGGLGLRAAARDLTALPIGLRLSRVCLELDGGDVLLVDLEVRRCQPFRSYLLGEQLHIGCSFIHMTPEARSSIDRFVQRLRR
jgi:flagellar brake protein